MNNEFNSNPTQENIYIQKRRFSAYESVFAWICLLFGFLLFHAVRNLSDPLWTMAVLTVTVIATMVVFFIRNKKFGFHWFSLGVFSIIFSASTIITGSGFMRALAIFSAIASYLFMVYTASDARLEKGSDMLPLDALNISILYPFTTSPGNLFRAFSGNGSKDTGMKIVKIVAGLVISIVPTTFIVINLSYDEDFSRLFVDVFRFFDNFSIISNVFAAIVGLITALYIFAIYVSSTNEEKKIFIKPNDCREFAKSIRFVPALTTVTALLPIIVVYIIFFISQWQYYVSAFTGVLPNGVESYAEYARSGFFQLCCVSVVNLVILLAVYLFFNRRTKADNGILKALAIVFSLMTLVLIGTALAKMLLYISAYGLTELRFLAFWFMSLLAVIFLLIILKQIIKPLKLISASAFVVAVMLCALVFCNYQGIIADYNVDRYLDGSIEKVDIYKLDDMGINSVPAMVKLADEWKVTPDSFDYDHFNSIQLIYMSDEELERFRLWQILYDYKQEFEDIGTYDRVAGFSLPEYRAHKAIHQWSAE